MILFFESNLPWLSSHYVAPVNTSLGRRVVGPRCWTRWPQRQSQLRGSFISRTALLVVCLFTPKILKRIIVHCVRSYLPFAFLLNRWPVLSNRLTGCSITQHRRYAVFSFKKAVYWLVMGRDQNLWELRVNMISRSTICWDCEIGEWQFSLCFVILSEKLAYFWVISCEIT